MIRSWRHILRILFSLLIAMSVTSLAVASGSRLNNVYYESCKTEHPDDSQNRQIKWDQYIGQKINLVVNDCGIFGSRYFVSTKTIEQEVKNAADIEDLIQLFFDISIDNYPRVGSDLSIRHAKTLLLLRYSKQTYLTTIAAPIQNDQIWRQNLSQSLNQLMATVNKELGSSYVPEKMLLVDLRGGPILQEHEEIKDFLDKTTSSGNAVLSWNPFSSKPGFLLSSLEQKFPYIYLNEKTLNHRDQILISAKQKAMQVLHLSYKRLNDPKYRDLDGLIRQTNIRDAHVKSYLDSKSLSDNVARALDRISKLSFVYAHGPYDFRYCTGNRTIAWTELVPKKVRNDEWEYFMTYVPYSNQVGFCDLFFSTSEAGQVVVLLHETFHQLGFKSEDHATLLSNLLYVVAHGRRSDFTGYAHLFNFDPFYAKVANIINLNSP